MSAREADSDFVPFAKARQGGGVEWYVTFTAAQNVTEGSLWRLMWDNAGSTVPIVIRPAGGTTVSASQPSYTGNVTVRYPDGAVLGGEANTSTSAVFTWEADWVFTDKPVEATS